MVLANFFFRKKTITTANIAKERLQIIIAERNIKCELMPQYLPALKNDLLQVIKKYVRNPKIISIQFKNKDKNTCIVQCLFSSFVKK